jgi:hypothetical protein
MNSCLATNAIFWPIVVDKARRNLTTTAEHVDGRRFVLNASALPQKVYVEDPAAAQPASRFRFALYRAASGLLTEPLVEAGNLDITRGGGTGIAVHIETDGTVVDFTGGGTVVFQSPGNRASPIVQSTIIGDGTCTNAGQTVTFDFDVQVLETSSNSRSIRRRVHARMSGGEIFANSSTGESLGDSDHTAELRLMLPRDSITVEFIGLRGSVSPTTFNFNGDSTLVRYSTCEDGFVNRPCLLVDGTPDKSTTATDFLTLIEGAVLDSFSQASAFQRPIEDGLIAPIG